jgi:hypothetical protein
MSYDFINTRPIRKFGVDASTGDGPPSSYNVASLFAMSLILALVTRATKEGMAFELLQ